MRTSSVLLIAAGVAVVAYVAINQRSPVSTGKTALRTEPKSSREALERGAISLGTQLGGKLIDTIFGRGTSGAAAPGSATGTGASDALLV
jgi:hypothetical protein